MSESDTERDEQVRARLAAATPGPWMTYDDRNVCEPVDDQGRQRMIAFDIFDADDRALIAHAPDDLARLLARAERAEAKVQRATALLHNARKRQRFEVGTSDLSTALADSPEDCP